MIMRTNLFDTLANLSNGTFVRIAATTEVSMNKRNNPLANERVEKITIATLQFGCSYENCVNNRTEEEFKAEGLPWGSWVEGMENKVIEHKGEYYVRLYEKKNDNRKVAYFVNGERATEEQIAIIKEFAKKSYSKKQAEVGIEKYEEQVRPRSYKFSSINWLKCGQNVYNGMIEVVER